jgi:hypothetical protein
MVPAVAISSSRTTMPQVETVGMQAPFAHTSVHDKFGAKNLPPSAWHSDGVMFSRQFPALCRTLGIEDLVPNTTDLLARWTGDEGARVATPRAPIGSGGS